MQHTVSNFELSAMYNNFFPKLLMFLDLETGFNAALTLLDTINVEFSFSHTDDNIDLPFQRFEYYNHYQNLNFSQEFSTLLFKNTNVNVLNSKIVEKPVVQIDFKLNFHNPESAVLLKNYLSNHNLGNYFACLYFFNAIKILNANNISLNKFISFKDVREKFHNKNSEPTDFIYSNILKELLVNSTLKKSYDFKAKNIGELIDKLDYKNIVANKTLFDTYDFNFIDIISHSFVISAIESTDDALYIKDIITKNIQNKFFIGTFFTQIHQNFQDFNNNIKELRDAEFLFLYQVIGVIEANIFNERFPNPSNEINHVLRKLKNFPYEKDLYDAFIPYIQN